MNRTLYRSLLIALALLLPFAGTAFLPAPAAFAQSSAPDVASDEEIIVVESNGRIRVDEPATGLTIWDSATDTGWVYVAAGDFNADGDAEIAAIRGSTLQIFDPFPISTVLWTTTLSSGRQFRFLVTGDFDADGRDEIAAAHTETSGTLPDTVEIYDGGLAGTSWTVVQWESFGYQWRDMATGDMNNDGHDDLALIRQRDNLLKVYSGLNWSTLAEDNYNFQWLTLGIGNISANWNGQEMALSRFVQCEKIDSLILFRYTSGFLTDLTPGVEYQFCPDFTSLSLGDLDGDMNNDEEVVLLRNVPANATSLQAFNPEGPPMRNFELVLGSGWYLVRTGDLDGDDKDEVVALRQNLYRMYMEPDQNDSQYVEVTGSFRIPPSSYDYSTMAIADVDGEVALLGVSPTSFSFNQNTTSGTINITNTGTSESIAWQAQVVEGSSWLRVTSGASGMTPGQARIGVDLSSIVPNQQYQGRVRITAAGAANSPVDVNVTLQVTDAGLLVSPKTLRLLQRVGGPPAEGRIQVLRPGGQPTEWVATAVEVGNLAAAMAAIESGQAQVSAEGVSFGPEQVPPPDWLTLSPDHDVTPSTMIVRANLAVSGEHKAIILIVAVSPSVPNRVQAVDVSAALVTGFGYLPLVVR